MTLRSPWKDKEERRRNGRAIEGNFLSRTEYACERLKGGKSRKEDSGYFLGIIESLMTEYDGIGD
jgi:hypothetical protein